MTREEALKILPEMKGCGSEWDTALDLAIEALRNSTTKVGDTISRQVAIDALDKRFDDVPMELTVEILQLRGDLRERIPSAQPQTGRWIYGEHDVAMCDGYRCDKCGFFVAWDCQHKGLDFIKDYHFCPNCGAKMKEVERGC